MEQVENQTPTTRRDAVLGRLKKRHPDGNFADDDSIFGTIDDDYGEAERNAQKMQEYEKNASAMVDMFYKNPRLAAFFNACKDGQDPIDFMIEHFGDDFRDALESEDGKARYGEKYQKWLDRVASEKKFEEESANNLDKTFETLDQFQQQHGLSDEQAADVFNKVHEIIVDGLMNIVKPETFEMALKAMNYDNDVKQAGDEGEIRGRNAKIEDKLRRKEAPADIPPTLGTAAGGSVEPKPKNHKRNPFVAYNED